MIESPTTADAGAGHRMMLEIGATANLAPTLEVAVRGALEGVCRHLGWPLARACIPGDEGAVGDALGTLWHDADPDSYRVFRRAVGDWVSGTDLAGRVLATRAPVWIEDVADDGSLPWGRAAAKAGIRGAFASPVTSQARIVAVLEFFSPQPAPIDTALLDQMGAVGTHLGHVFLREEAAMAAQRIVSVVEHSDHAIYTVGLDGCVQTWNRGARDLLGYRDEEILGRSVSVLVPEDRGLEFRYYMSRALVGEAVPLYETRRRHKDGSEVAVSLSVGPVHDRCGRLTAMSVIMRGVAGQWPAEPDRAHAVLRGRRVLMVVDDAAAGGEALVHHLQAWGCRHTVLDDPERALDLLRLAALHDCAYDLVLVDRHASAGDGADLAADIRAHPWLASIPVVVLVAGDASAEAAGTDGPLAAWLRGPVRPGRLLEAMARVLGTAALAEMAAPATAAG